MWELPSPVGTRPHPQCLSESFSRSRILEQGWLLCWTAKKGHFPDRIALVGWLQPGTGQDFLVIPIPQRGLRSKPHLNMAGIEQASTPQDPSGSSELAVTPGLREAETWEGAGPPPPPPSSPPSPRSTLFSFPFFLLCEGQIGAMRGWQRKDAVCTG